nr:transketolase C-terminal domain-containing protein [Streptomyces antibioticus]
MARAVEVRSIWSRWGQPLLPIGVVYDPFVNRALGPWSFGIYAGGQSILVGTPSGVTLAPEGGAHQSVTTPSLGIEQPGCVTYEPAFVIDTEWCLLAALGALPGDPAARERRRRHVTAGAYRLRQHEKPVVTLAAMGALVPEALAAADRLTALGHDADVVCVTSPDLLWILDQVFPADRATPLVTVLDGHPHTLAFLGTIHDTPVTTLGVTRFGQSGSIEDVYRHHGIDTDSIVAAALDLVD